MSQAEELQAHVDTNFGDEKLYEGFCSHFYSQEDIEMYNEIEDMFRDLND